MNNILIIIKAEYGILNKYIDITDKVIELFVKNNELYIPKSTNLNNVFTDPYFSLPKEIKIELTINNKTIYICEKENCNHLLKDIFISGNSIIYKEKIIFLISHEDSNTGAVNCLLNLQNFYENLNFKTKMLFLADVDSKNIVSYIKNESNKVNSFPILFCNTLLCYNIIKEVINTDILTYWYIHEWYDNFTKHYFSNIINDINTFNLMKSPINVIFICQESLNNYKKYINFIDNKNILYNSYNENILNIKLNEKQDIFTKNKDDIIISIIGTVEDRKNQQSFINNVFYRCKEKYPNIKLLLVGKLSIELNIEDKYKNSIITIGSVKNALPFIELSDIIVSYSINEVLPLNIIESFYCGKPVISTNVGGISEIINNYFNGFLININEHQKCFDLICELIEKPYLINYIGKNAKNKFSEKFSENDSKNTYLSLIKNNIPTHNDEINYDFNLFEIKQNLTNKNVCFIHFTNINNNDYHYKNIFMEQINYIKSSGLYNKLDFIFITMLGEYTEIINDNKIKLIYYSPNIYEWEFPNYKNIKYLCDNIPFNINILEIHTKGALKKPHSYEWRKYLEYFLIEKYELCLDLLNKYKCVGVNQYFYFTEEDKYRNLFSGNFWWSRSDYLKTLPPIEVTDDRYSIEHWIIGNLYKNDYRNFISLHQSDYDFYKTSIMPYEYRLDIIKDAIYYNLNYTLKKTKPIYGIYFICCIGNYLNIIKNQIQQLIESGLYNETEKIICFVCMKTNECLELLQKYDKIQIISTDENLYEKFAINNYKNYINCNDYNLFYIHSKSATRKEKCFFDWLELCNYFTINKWRLNVELLNYYDCVGTNLKNYPKKHYSGNFWWAKSQHLSKLKNINDGYLSSEMYILSYMKTNYVSLYQSYVNHGCTEYNKCNYNNKSNEELINNICIIPDFNPGDKRCIIHCGELDLSCEPPILELN